MKLEFWVTIFTLILASFLTLSILFVFRFLPPKLPLFYSLAWGDLQLATHQQFLIIPASIVLANLLNLVLSWQLHSTQTFFKRILILSSLVVNLIFVITFIKIVLIFV